MGRDRVSQDVIGRGAEGLLWLGVVPMLLHECHA